MLGVMELRSVYAQTDEEKALFNTLRVRYQDEAAPQSVRSIIDSFDAEQSVVYPPLPGEQYGVTLKFTFQLVTWNPPEMHRDRDALVQARWEYEDKGPPKIVKISFSVMFNLATMQPRENSERAIDRITNDAIFYHEMLHGYLHVHQKIESDENWRKDFSACKKDFEFTSLETQHATISPWENQYFTIKAQNEGYVVLERNIAVPATIDGSFFIQTDLDKEQIRPTYLLDSTINVRMDSLKWKYIEGKGWGLYGRLLDKNKAGRIKAIIDPTYKVMILEASISANITVGGIVVSVDKLAPLAPYIGLASTIVVAAVATTVYIKRVKHKCARSRSEVMGNVY
jgi:hypothetical protein